MMRILSWIVLVVALLISTVGAILALLAGHARLVEVLGVDCSISIRRRKGKP
jgi:hypothetical protein